MAQVVLGAVGAGIGSAFGGAKGAQWGFSAGVLLAGVLFPPRGQRQDHGKLDDLRVSGSQYGAMIPQVYGLGRVGGLLVWVEKDENGNHLRESSRPIRSQAKGGTRNVGRQYTYSCTMAWLICRGPIESVRRIWAEDKVIYDASASPTSKYTIRTYLGEEDQVVDPAIEAAEGVDQWTAYRGTAYCVMEDFPLGDWGNRIPAMTFEVAGIGADLGTDDLLAWYRFEDSPGFLQDSGPNNYDLTQTGTGATQVPGPPGYGEAVSMPVPSNTLQSAIGDLPAFTGPEWSVATWFRYTGTGVSGFHGFVTYRSDDFYTPGYLLLTGIGGGEVTIEFRVELDDQPYSISIHSTDYPSILDGNWHHVAGTRKIGGQMRLYYDRAIVAEIDTPFASVTITSPGSLLEITNAPGGTPAIEWDDVQFWERELTPNEVAGYAGVRVDVILADQFDQVGLAPAEYDVTAAAARRIPGYVLGSRVDLRQADRELLMLTDLDLAEVDGQIEVVARGGPNDFTILEEDMGAYVAEAGVEAGNPPDRVQVRRLPVSELPYRLDLEYLSTANNYQQGQATAVRFTRVAETHEQITVSTPLVLDDAFGRHAAETLLYRQWWERVQFVTTLPPKYLYLAPGDVGTLPVAGTTVRARIEQADVDPFGVIQLSLVQDAAEILTQFVEPPSIPAPFEGLPAASTTLLVAWSGNALLDAHATAGDVGFYAAAGGPPGQDWPGATLFWSRDGGATYEVLDSLTDNATLGTAATELSPPGGGAYDLWDDTNTIDVTITSGEPPETSSDEAVLNGANAAILGDEVIQFVTVTSLGNNQYRLSRLLRGRRGTEVFGADHQVGERFALLEDGFVKRVTVGRSLVGAAVQLKAVTAGTTVESASPVSLTITGRELFPYAPAHVAGTRDGSQNLNLTWFRRARAGGEWADLRDVDQPEATLAYEVDILDGSDVVRTLTATDESVVYTAAQQTTDFGSPQASLSVIVYQLGAIGRGYGAPATV